MESRPAGSGIVVAPIETTVELASVCRCGRRERSALVPSLSRSLTRTVIGLYSDRKVTMRAIRISEDIVPVSEFKAQAAECLRRVSATGQPIIITQNGKAAGVLLSPSEFDRLSERVRFVAAVEEGLADADAGLLRDHDEVVERMWARAKRKRNG